MKKYIYTLATPYVMIASQTNLEAADSFTKDTHPNIILILADDMGYGDISSFNPNSKTKTPHLDEMASEGVRFTQAFSSSGVSTPSRYSVVTGRYFFRTTMKKGVINGHGSPVIEKGRSTIASVLKKQGYTTGVIGKWHLGVEWQKKDESKPLTPQRGHSEETNVDYTKNVTYGPKNYGFDYSYILPASLDMPPYLFLKNHKVVGGNTMGSTRKNYAMTLPTTIKNYDTIHISNSDIYWGSGVWWRQGEMSEEFKVENCLQDITLESLSFIERNKNKDTPFFLYIPLTSPHTPWLPDSSFVGKYDVGDYGAFIAHTDDIVGQIRKKVKDMGIDNNTIIIFSSDNGAPWPAQEIQKWNHNPNEGRRGQKGDIYDGGHHVPLIVEARSLFNPHQCEWAVSLVDIFATISELTNYQSKSNEGEDSKSFLPLLNGKSQSVRDHIIFHSSDGMLAIRKENWKYIEDLGSGGFSAPRRVQSKPSGESDQLYSIDNDPLEQNNLSLKFPNIVKQLSKELDRICK